MGEVEDAGTRSSLPERAREAALGSVGAATGGVAGTAVGGPVGAGLGAVLGWGVDVLVGTFRDRFGNRIGRLLQLAADEAGLDLESLVERLQALELEELVHRSLQAAAQAGEERRLVALARAVAAGATTQNELVIDRETAFATDVAAMSRAHVYLLQRFTMSAAELGLGSGTDPMRALSRHQLLRVAPELEEVLDSLLAVLQARGMVTPVAGGATMGGGGGPVDSWKINHYGTAFLARLELLGEAFRDSDAT